jgi:maleate isomerase
VTGDRLTVGVVTPHEAAGPEVELPAMTRGRLATVVSRTGSPLEASQTPSVTSPTAHAELRASTEPAALDRAAMTFSGRTLAAVAHASTTCGYVIGPCEEAALADRLSQRFDVPAVASCAAAAAALRAHGVGQVQLVHPPWFDDEFDELGAAYFRSQGFDAVVTKAVGLPDDPARVDPQHVVDWIEHHVEDRAEALFLAGNGFRAAGAVEEAELRTGRLVLEANQALLWGILAATGTRWDVTGHGRLLRVSSSTTVTNVIGHI